MMKRRDFLRSAGIASAAFAFPKASRLCAEDAAPRGWRTFEVTTRVVVLNPSGATRVWLPTALIGNTPFQKTLANQFNAEGGTAHIVEKRADGLGIVAATFPVGVKPLLTLTSRISTKDYAVDLSVENSRAQADYAELQYCLRPTKLLPTDGIVQSDLG